MPNDAITCFVVLSLAASVCASEVRRLIAVGDLHGDLQAAKDVLKLAKVLGVDGEWTGGRAVVVQLGDVTDRGRDSAACVEFFERLAVEAEAAGGEVVSLLGNHEMMNLMGDLRYVHPQEMKEFGGREEWKRAWAPTGRYGQKLVRLPAVVQKGDTAFVHAGLSAPWASLGINEINSRVRAALAAEDWRSPILGARGVFWLRSQVQAAEDGRCDEVFDALEALRVAAEAEQRPVVNRIVVGHTIQRGGKIGVYCGGSLIAADIAMSSAITSRGYLGYVDLTVSGHPKVIYKGDIVVDEDL